MIVSEENRYIFIRPQRIGGTSLHRILRYYDSSVWKLEDHFPEFDRHHVPSHRLNEVLKQEKIDTYFKFSFTRNPWDRMVSTWKYMQKQREEGLPPLEFDRFIKQQGWKWKYSLMNHVDFIGEVDFIGRFENLQDDFDKVSDMIGIKRRNLPKVNGFERAHYSTYYNEETKGIVADLFQKDIMKFNYKFEG